MQDPRPSARLSTVGRVARGPVTGAEQYHHSRPLTCANIAQSGVWALCSATGEPGSRLKDLGEQLNKKTIRLGIAGALAALSLAGPRRSGAGR